MTEYYIDATLSTGDNDGSTKPNAWRSLQEAIDSTNNAGKPAAGDTVLLRHTASPDEQPTAAVNVDGTTGTNIAVIEWIGVNSSWVEDGTKYELDFQNATATNGLYFSAGGVDFTVWKHIEVYLADDSGFHIIAGSNPHIFIACISHNNGDDGFDTTNSIYGAVIGCLAYSNGGDGFKLPARGLAAFCCARDNTENGFYNYSGTPETIYNCLSFGNSRWGLNSYRSSSIILNSAFDNNVYDQVKLDTYSAYTHYLIGCRMTNAPASYYGIDGDLSVYLSGYNYFQSNTAGNEENVAGKVNLNLITSATTDQEDQGDTDEGYESLTEDAEDYRLASDATGFSQAVQIPTGQP